MDQIRGSSSGSKLCVIPLQWGVMPSPTLQIGKFRLRLLDEEGRRRLCGLFRSSAEQVIKSPSSRDWFIEHFERHVTEHLSDLACLEVQYFGTTEEARNFAYDEARTLLDLLRFAAPLVGFGRKHCNIGILGEPMSGVIFDCVIGLDDSQTSQSFRRTHEWIEYEFSDRTIEILRRLGVVRMAQALSDELNPLQRSIMNAIHWAAQAHVQWQAKLELVNLIIALESLFEIEDEPRPRYKRNIQSTDTRCDWIPKTDKLCIAAAVLEEPEQSHRAQVYCFYKDAFYFRGEVVHRGREFADPSFLANFQRRVTNLITKSIEASGTFHATKDLVTSLLEQGSRLKDEAGWVRPNKRTR